MIAVESLYSTVHSGGSDTAADLVHIVPGFGGRPIWYCYPRSNTSQFIAKPTVIASSAS